MSCFGFIRVVWLHTAKRVLGTVWLCKEVCLPSGLCILQYSTSVLHSTSTSALLDKGQQLCRHAALAGSLSLRETKGTYNKLANSRQSEYGNLRSICGATMIKHSQLQVRLTVGLACAVTNAPVATASGASALVQGFQTEATTSSVPEPMICAHGPAPKKSLAV